jgi:probable F420-dependent oxidoreductase
MHISIGLFGVQDWFGGDFAPAIALGALADRAGVDSVNLSDHVVMSEATDAYPYGSFSMPPSYPFYEPMTVLSALAGATSRIRLTAILISPLRPAVFLAKQLATLDVLSRGRLTVGFGVGWQKEEYDSCGVPWEGRFRRMEEQVLACRELWRNAPASFHGETVAFDRLYSLPFPVQPGGPPIWFGLPASERNFARIAKFRAGWHPMPRDPAILAADIGRLKQVWQAAGWPASELEIRQVVVPVMDGQGRPDFQATIAEKLPPLTEAGVTILEFHPFMYCRGPDEAESFFREIVALKATAAP